MSMSLPRVKVQAGGTAFDFVQEPSLRRAGAFHLGAFFSKAVLSDEVFRYPRRQRIAVLSESPIDVCYRRIDEVVRRFPLVYTHQRQLLARGGPFRPLLFGTNWIGVRDEAAERAILDSSPPKSRLVSFIGSLDHPDEGAYRLRRQVAEFLTQGTGVDCYGKGIRPIDGKREAIASYRFSVAMENAASDHYFSEKLVDCLLLETVPIYYGCPGISECLDPRGLICFRTVEELREILDTLDARRYDEMRPFVLANKRTVVERRWHNHAGLFARLAEGLSGDAPLRLAPVNPSGAIVRRLRQWGVPI